MMGLAKSDCKPIGCGGCAGAEAGACAKNTFKPFKCIIEKWSDTLGKLKGLASVIGRSSYIIPLSAGFHKNELRHGERYFRSAIPLEKNSTVFFDLTDKVSDFVLGLKVQLAPKFVQTIRAHELMTTCRCKKRVRLQVLPAAVINCF
jgi:hypothetical protein